ncbi:MAG TPA: hypothetical protein VJX66_01145 [Amycolatopsis sp.]|nr:hypothetical protein [Amycolatopsis sp.]
MGKNAARITGFGFSLAVTASLALAPAASADPSPTLNGDCAATLQNDPAGSANSGLLLDAGAPLNAPDRLTLGLDSTAKQTNGGNPLLSLPLGDTVRALGLGDAPVVGDVAANAVCPAAQGTLNAVGGTTQNLVGGVGLPPLPVPPNPPQPKPPAPKPPAPAPPGNSTGPITTGPGGSGLPGDAIAGIFTDAALLPGNLIEAPVVTEVIPGETSKVPTIDEQQSGNAQALPAVVPPAKLPMLLAVLALAVVAAALVRAWLRRKPV